MYIYTCKYTYLCLPIYIVGRYSYHFYQSEVGYIFEDRYCKLNVQKCTRASEIHRDSVEKKQGEGGKSHWFEHKNISGD